MVKWMLVSAAEGDEVVEREAIVFSWQHEHEEQQCKSGNHVFVKRIERFVQEVAEGYDCKNEAERDERFAYPETDNQQGARDKFDKRDRDAGGPERPDRKKSVGKGKEVFTRVIERAQLKNFVQAGHEEDETQHFSCEEDCPAAGKISFHGGCEKSVTLLHCYSLSRRLMQFALVLMVRASRSLRAGRPRSQHFA